MVDIKFYSNPQSRGQIVHWMLEELGEPYDIHWVEYGEQMKCAEYLAINPMGKVPALTHKGKVVTECAAICTYLAATYPEKKLMPSMDDPMLADFYRWMFFAAGPVEQVMTMHSMGWSTTEDKSRTLGFGTAASTLDALEVALSNGAYICGENFTAVDVYLGSVLNWGMMFGTLEKRNIFEKYVSRLVNRPAFLAMQQATQAQIVSAE